ncbi:MAG: hypothetical protein WBB23_12445 [Desulforhopalus sp.]
MKRIFMIGIFIIFITVSISYGDPQKVKGLYQENLIEYSEKGKKIGELNIQKEKIIGAEVLDTTPRKLVKINYDGKERWFRASQLEFSMPDLPKCPQGPPGQSIDRQTPVASGMGAQCEE